MAVLAKPANKVVLIKAEESKSFIKQFNKNKVDTEFLDSCKKTGKLFEGRK